MKNKPIIEGIILLFLFSSIINVVSSSEVSSKNIITSNYEREEDYSITNYQNGSLSGYVNDSSSNPIEGTLVSIN